LNLAKEAEDLGVWEKYNVRLIGVDIKAIDKAEDREKFRQWMIQLGVPVAPARTANSFLEGKEFAQQIGFPLVIRPSFTLGGTGGGIVFEKDELDEALTRGLQASPIHEVLVEKALMGWKEFELELLRDANDNVVIICTVENFDPMGVHTGDSITVAPAMTLSDTAFQLMRNTAIKMMRDQSPREPFICFGIQSDRLPHCQDRLQAGYRLYFGRIEKSYCSNYLCLF